jgi:predicted dehydrogenase
LAITGTRPATVPATDPVSRDGSPLRVGLVGCGAVAARYHAPALAQGEAMGWVRVAHLVDPDRARIAAVRSTFPDAASIGVVEELEGKVDLAVIASPVRFHAQQATALLERGIHVLCEKPIALTSTEAEAMVAAARSSGRVLAVGLYRRFFPAVEWIGQLIRSGVLGRPISFHCDEGGRFGWPAVTPSFFDREQSGGGATMDMGVHLFDILIHWFGMPQSFDYCDDAYGGVEVNASGTLRHASGLAGTFRLSWDVPLSGVYAIDFERGWIRWPTNSAHSVNVVLDGVDYGCEARLAAADRELPRGLAHPAPGYVAAFTSQLRDVVQAIREGRAPRIDGKTGATALGLIEHMYAKRRIFMPAHFTEAERTRAGQLALGREP